MTKNIIMAMVAALALCLNLTACEEDDDGCTGDECDTDSDTDGDTDSDTDGDTDSDTDGDTDSDTDGDTDGDTDSDTEPDPTACDCLNGVSTDEGCYDISGDWYGQGYPHDDLHLLSITLTIAGSECKAESTGTFAFWYIHTGIMLPLEFYSEEDDQHEQLYMEEVDADTLVFHVKRWGQYSNSDTQYER